MNLKFKKDGSTVVTLNNDKKNQIHIDPIHPAAAVDKTHSIVPNHQMVFSAGTVRKTQDEQMQEALDELYDGNVQIETSNNHGFVGIDKLNVTDDYKGHGVESHVLASIVVERRHDLYNFASKADLPHAEYVKAGFEPNPYHFAGQTHPDTGQVFPSISDLDKFSNDRENPNHWEYSYHDLWAARDAAAYPYLRLKHGHRLSETPLRKDPVDPKQVAKIRAARAERWDRAQAARSTYNILDLH
jgi:hypothetical protein